MIRIDKSISKETGHITVTGFIGDNKDTPAKKIKSAKVKLKAAKKIVSAAKNDFEDAFELQVKIFKLEAVDKISQAEMKIIELKDKISSTSKELGLTYQDNIDKLEQSKKVLADRLDEYKEKGAEDWECFKHKFNEEIGSFENTVTSFLEQLKMKSKPEDKTTV